MDNYEKLTISIRYWMLGKGFFTALEAMSYASKFHTGFRKDGITPEFMHQVSIAHYLRSLTPHLMFPEETFCAAFLHDVVEDYDPTADDIIELFGERSGLAVRLLTKTSKDKKRLPDYYGEIAECPIASAGKGADRVHNIQSMPGVFTLGGQKWYIEETEKYILPMLKQARRNFPRQEMAYENIKHMLVSQVQLIKAIHEAGEKNNGPSTLPKPQLQG